MPIPVCAVELEVDSMKTKSKSMNIKKLDLSIARPVAATKGGCPEVARI